MYIAFSRFTSSWTLARINDLEIRKEDNMQFVAGTVTHPSPSTNCFLGMVTKRGDF